MDFNHFPQAFNNFFNGFGFGSPFPQQPQPQPHPQPAPFFH
ncbi:hypothetical protein [Rhodococcus sp. NPDC003322]